MRKKLIDIAEAFATGFVIVSLVLLMLHLFAPTFGIDYQSGWSPMIHSTGGVVYISFIAPILIGVVFAVVELFNGFERHVHKRYKKMVHTKRMHQLVYILASAAWGLAIGFVVSMFLFAILAGLDGAYTIPYLFSAVASDGTVKGSTAIISVSALLGLAWGAWRTMAMDKALKRMDVKKVKKALKRKGAKKARRRK